MGTYRSKLMAGAAILAIAAAALVFIANYRGHAVQRRDDPVQRSAAAVPPRGAAPVQTARTATTRTTVAASERSRRMAAAFDSGVLPEPLPLPRGRFDVQAEALAREFSAARGSSVAALYAATLASGYVVRKPDGTLAQPAHSQGLGFEWWEIAALAKLYGRGYGVTLGHLSETLRRAFPQLKDAPLTDDFRDGLRAALRGNDEALRFWARFIIDLGHYADEPYDLLHPGDASAARLNPVQVAFLLTRVAGELAATTRPRPAAAAHPPAQVRPWSMPQNFFFPALLAQDKPCGFSNELSIVADYFALVSTSVVGGIVGHFSEVAGGRLGAANLINTIVKFILSYALLDVTISMDAEELIRTKDFDPGDYRRLTATLKIDTSKAQYVNCLRTLAVLSGVDFTIPDNGPVADARLEWKTLEGGTIVRGSGSNRWVEHGIFYFEALESVETPDGTSTPDRSPAKQFTDKDGNSTMYAVGAPQERDLSRGKTTEIRKQAGVKVNVQLKGRVKGGAGLASEFGSVFGSAISFLTGDPLGGVVGTISEMAYRSSWYASEPFFFDVIDWQPCGNRWSGTIEYAADFHDTGSGIAGNNLSAWDKSDEYVATLSVVPPEGDAIKSHITATASKKRANFGRGLDTCYRVSSQIQQLQGNISAPVDVRISTPGGGRYNVSYSLPLVPAKGTYTATSDVAGQCNNPFNKPVRQNEEASDDLDPGPGADISGDLDPAHPDIIRGATFVDRPAGAGAWQASAFWSLVRCQ